jgi:hypothetical protein
MPAQAGIQSFHLTSIPAGVYLSTVGARYDDRYPSRAPRACLIGPGLNLAQQELCQHAVKLLGLFDLGLMGRVPEAMYSRAGDDFLKVYIPIALV